MNSHTKYSLSSILETKSVGNMKSYHLRKYDLKRMKYEFKRKYDFQKLRKGINILKWISTFGIHPLNVPKNDLSSIG